MSKCFLDTNILIYALDGRDKKKQKKARQLLKNDQIVISTQVLQEFYVASVSKLGHDPVKIKSLIHLYSENFETILIDTGLVKEAVDISVLNKLSYWDSLVVATAEKAKVVILYTEDLHHEQIVRGVRIVNPFL